MARLETLFFEQPHELERLNLLRMIVVALCALLVLLGPYDTQYHIDAAPLMFRPLFPFTFAGEPSSYFAVLKTVTLILAPLAFIGNRAGLWSFTLAYCFLNYLIHCYQAHFCMNLAHLNFALFALCFAGRNPFRASWALTLMASLIVLMFFQAGLAKLVYGGLGWFTSGDTLYVETIVDGTDFGRSLTSIPGFFVVMSLATGLFELGIPVLFFFPRMHPLIPLILMSFHLGTFVVMGISFWFLWPIYIPLYLPYSPKSMIAALPRATGRVFGLSRL